MGQIGMTKLSLLASLSESQRYRTSESRYRHKLSVSAAVNKQFIFLLWNNVGLCIVVYTLYIFLYAYILFSVFYAKGYSNHTQPYIILLGNYFTGNSGGKMRSRLHFLNASAPESGISTIEKR